MESNPERIPEQPGEPADPAGTPPRAPQAPQAPPAPDAPGTGEAPGEGGRPWPTLGQRDSYGDEPPPGFHPPPYGEAPPSYGDQSHHGGGQLPAPRRVRRLFRSEHDRMIAGVCGGLKEFTGIDANLLRVAFVLLALFGSGAGLLLYVVAWALIPRESRLGLSPTDTVMDAVDEVRDRFQGIRRA